MRSKETCEYVTNGPSYSHQLNRKGFGKAHKRKNEKRHLPGSMNGNI